MATQKTFNENVYNNALASLQAGEKPTYAGTFENQLNDIYDKIQNREKFSYDVNADPLYNAYKDKYVQQGKAAMQDTMGRAAALTGGYGSSYGQQVGQQAYNAYLQNLTDVIPQLYGMAQQSYQQEGNNLKDLYNMAAANRDTEYNRYLNELNQYNTNRNLALQMEQQDYERNRYNEELQRALENQEYERNWNQNQRDYERGIYADQIARQLEAQEYERAWNENQRTYERQNYSENLEYNKMQDAKKNVLAMIQLGATPTDAELAAAGITRDQANAIYAQLFPAPVAAGGGGYYGGGGGSSQPATQQPTTNTTYTLRDVAAAYAEDKASNDKTVSKQATKNLNALVNNGVITKEEKKIIQKDYQVKDRL